MEENRAIARLRQGDIAGLEALVLQHQLRAVRTVYLITGDRALAEDIVQTAFVRVYHRIHQFDSERAFAPWFFKSLVNDALKAVRRGQRQVSLDAAMHAESGTTWAELLAAPAADPADAVEEAELRQQGWSALRQLPAEQRAAVVMRYYLGFSEAEAAAALDVATGTIKWRLHRARQRLQTLLHPSATEQKG